MADLSKLEKILKKGIAPKTKDNKVLLKESGKDAILKEIEVCGLDNEALVLKIDEMTVQFFTGGGPAKRCDYVIFSTVNGKQYAVFVEIKSTHISGGEYLIQFKASQCLIDYFNSVLNRFESGNDLLNMYEHRFVLFYAERIPKSPTRPIIPKNNGNSTPKKVLRLPNIETIDIGTII